LLLPCGYNIAMRSTCIALLAVSACLAGSQTSPRTKAEKTCLANRQTIANAVQATRVQRRLSNYGSLMGPVVANKFPDLRDVPICLGAGKYFVLPVKKDDASNYRVRCSVHGDFQPGR
jgi:hypothetical protein